VTGSVDVTQLRDALVTKEPGYSFDVTKRGDGSVKILATREQAVVASDADVDADAKSAAELRASIESVDSVESASLEGSVTAEESGAARASMLVATAIGAAALLI
jgi:hypothetical protein